MTDSKDDPSQYLHVPWWRSFVLRFVCLYSLLAVVLLGVSIERLHRSQKREIADKFGLALKSIAASTALCYRIRPLA